MGLIVPLESRRSAKQRLNVTTPRHELLLILARLLAAGATDFTRVALDAWGRHEIEPEELLELCTTYASVAGLETLA